MPTLDTLNFQLNDDTYSQRRLLMFTKRISFVLNVPLHKKAAENFNLTVLKDSIASIWIFCRSENFHFCRVVETFNDFESTYDSYGKRTIITKNNAVFHSTFCLLRMFGKVKKLGKNSLNKNGKTVLFSSLPSVLESLKAFDTVFWLLLQSQNRDLSQRFMFAWERSYIHNGVSFFCPFLTSLKKIWFKIKSHKFAMSLFIIEIHFSGGKLELLHRKSASWKRERRDREKAKKIKVSFCADGVLGNVGVKPRTFVFFPFFGKPLSTPYF